MLNLPPLASSHFKHFLQLLINIAIICQGVVMHHSGGIKPTNPNRPIHPKYKNIRNIMTMCLAIIEDALHLVILS
jgi:hypothetical protein